MQWDIKDYRFDNGSRLFYVQTPADDVSIIANINAGSLHETDETAGISHLVEHMLFKGTEKRPSSKRIWNEINVLGKNFNAFTSNDHICIETKVVLDDFEKSLDLISDMLYYSVFDKKELEKEKQIVLDEVRVWKDDPDVALFDMFDSFLYRGTVFARPIIGYEDSVSDLAHSTVLDFYKTHFNPSNTTLFVAGPKNFDVVIDKIKKHFIKDIDKGFPRYLMGSKLPENSHKERFFEKPFENTHFLMGRILDLQLPDDFYSLKVLSLILDNRVTNRIRDKEPIAYTSGVIYHKDVAAHTLNIYGSCDHSKYKRVKECIFEELEKVANGKFSDKNVLDSIDSKRKEFILDSGTTFAKVKRLHGYWLNSHITYINNYLDSLKRVTPDKVREAAARYLKTDDLTILGIGKKKSYLTKFFDFFMSY